MKKLFLSLFLYQLTSSVLALNWGEYITSNDKGRYFVETSTIKKNGNLVSFFVLHNRYKPDLNMQGKKYSSTVSLFEFNCQNRTARIAISSEYSGQMGKGDMVSSLNEKTSWQTASSGSTLDTLLYMACRSW